MGRQRNRPHVKEQENSPKEELDEMEASNLSDREFRVMIIYKYMLNIFIACDSKNCRSNGLLLGHKKSEIFHLEEHG